MDETVQLLARARESLERAIAERDAEQAALRQREREVLAEHNEEIARLRRVIRTLDEKPKRTTRPAAVQAGPKALAAVRKALADGPLPQKEITHRTKLNDGTVSYAMRALVEAGEIAATGKRIEGSRVFRLTRRARKAA